MIYIHIDDTIYVWQNKHKYFVDLKDNKTYFCFMVQFLLLSKLQNLRLFQNTFNINPFCFKENIIYEFGFHMLQFRTDNESAKVETTV